MRIVLDTNILARAAYSFAGPAAEVMEIRILNDVDLLALLRADAADTRRTK